MVRINDILGLSLLVIASSTLLKSRNGDPYSLKNLQVSPKEFYQVKTDFNLENIARIQDSRERLTALSSAVRDQTLKFERQKADQKLSIWGSKKAEAGALLSQLEKFVQTGYKHETYSPRVRALIGKRRGYDPVKPELIERGKKARGFIPGIENIINTIDQNILKIKSNYSSLESI